MKQVEAVQEEFIRLMQVVAGEMPLLQCFFRRNCAPHHDHRWRISRDDPAITIIGLLLLDALKVSFDLCSLLREHRVDVQPILQQSD
jgi:hypothetical protein